MIIFYDVLSITVFIGLIRYNTVRAQVRAKWDFVDRMAVDKKPA